MDAMKTGRFVHVVASVRIDDGTGKLLYVHPSTVTTAPDPNAAAGQPAPGATPFVLRVDGADGKELARFEPAVQLPSDRHEGPPTGLIDEDIPFVPGMKRLVLLHGDKVVSEFEAGQPEAADPQTVRMGAAPPGQPEKRGMAVEGHDVPQPGVSYTIQVKPESQTAWQTIAIGRPTAKFSIDRNQFPGAEKAQVRVLRDTGFESALVGEEEVDLRFEDQLGARADDGARSR